MLKPYTHYLPRYKPSNKTTTHDVREARAAHKRIARRDATVELHLTTPEHYRTRGDPP